MVKGDKVKDVSNGAAAIDAAKMLLALNAGTGGAIGGAESLKAHYNTIVDAFGADAFIEVSDTDDSGNERYYRKCTVKTLGDYMTKVLALAKMKAGIEGMLTDDKHPDAPIESRNGVQLGGNRKGTTAKTDPMLEGF